MHDCMCDDCHDDAIDRRRLNDRFRAELEQKGENTSFLINSHSILYENKSYYA